MHIEIIGLLAAICTTIAFLPQVLRTWKTRSVADISLSMYLVLCTGLVLWLVYGLYIGSLPVVLANAVTLVLAGAVLVMRIRYFKK